MVVVGVDSIWSPGEGVEELDATVGNQGIEVGPTMELKN
jgi:hypothetical protein